MTLHWSAGYVGTPYVDHGRGADGCDCWGLVRLVLQQERQIDLPSYMEISPAEVREIASAIDGEVAAGAWQTVARPAAFDVAVFRRGRFDSHVGIMIDNRHMLHSDKQAGRACIERVDAGRWTSQFAGYYRHRDLI